MARDPKYDILFEPIQIGPKVLPNRFFQVAHCNGAGSERPGFQSHFRAMKAEGGWGAVCTEYCSIGPESDDVHRVSARLWDDGDVRNLGLMCDMLHDEGALAAVEIWHGGLNACGLESRVPARGASAIGSPFAFMRPCKEMDKQDIREVQQLYVDACKRARDAGFDILVLYCAHNEALLHQFLLPFFNRRTDEYGGSFENRARFSREVLEQVREAIGDDCAISIRFGVDTLDLPHGLGDRGVRQEGEGVQFIEHMDHLVDMWDINVGNAVEWGEDAAPSRTHPENHEGPYVDKVKQHTNKPVLNVGRFVNPDTMVEVITSGQCDIIGAARPSIADPFLPLKIKEGRLDDIRECIGCNVCISRWEIGGPPLVCTQNATSGEEYRRGWHPEKFTTAANADNDVLVIGAGPAGMECAMVLGRRGMRRVHLVESAPEIGGQMRWVPKLPGLGEWGRVVNYRQIQLDKLKNVEVMTGTTLDAEGVLDYGAEIVIVATGSHWAHDGFQGLTNEPIPGADASLEHVVTPEQVMLEGKTVGQRVVVYDCETYFTGVGMAEKLVREGKDVTYVTAFDGVAPYTRYTLEYPRLSRSLRELGIDVVLEHVLVSVEPGSAPLADIWTDEERVVECDTVVLVTQRIPDDALYRELAADEDALAAAGIKGLYQIGDCLLPSLIAEAVFSGHRLAREIDSPNPRVPLPYIRERRLVNATDEDFRLDSAATGAVAG
jgi:dimethylamine/trimethylamine dehydrogenase